MPEPSEVIMIYGDALLTDVREARRGGNAPPEGSGVVPGRVQSTDGERDGVVSRGHQ